MQNVVLVFNEDASPRAIGHALRGLDVTNLSSVNLSMLDPDDAVDTARGLEDWDKGILVKV